MWKYTVSNTVIVLAKSENLTKQKVVVKKFCLEPPNLPYSLVATCDFYLLSFHYGSFPFLATGKDMKVVLK